MIGKRIALGTVAAIGFIAASAPAYAQATRTWISGVGDDVNPCSRTAPCKTFQGALPKTAAGGEINCLDPGGFGGVTITKSITLLCDNTQSGVLVASTNGIIINGANAVVTISGFDIEGLGQTGSPGVNGIYILNAAVVRIKNTKIRGFRNGFGIYAAPSSQSLLLFVDNVSVSEGGIGSNLSTGGIGFFPANGFGVNASIRNTAVTNNLKSGLRLDTTGTTGTAVSLQVENSQINGNGNGILIKAPAGTGTARLMLNNSTVSQNTGFALFANGTGAVARVDDTAITGNATGVNATNGGTVSSYGTNQLDGNTNDGAFTGTIPPK
jgi:hypothetical protein